MPRNSLHDIAIIATHNTRQARRLEGENDMSLIMEAIRGVIAQAGIKATDIDGVNVNTPVWGLSPREASQLLGTQPRWVGNDFMGIAAVMEAAGAIATGQAEMVLVGSAQAGEYGGGGAVAPWTRPTHEFVESYGLYTAAEFAFSAQRHMHLYGTKQEALAEVAATVRNNGARHPLASCYGKDPITADDVLASRMVASPFHLLDCCLTSEGGAALLITTAERARDLDVDPIYILGAGTDRQGLSYTRAPVWDTYGAIGQRAAKRAYGQAGMGPGDIDVCEFYDPFSFEIIRQFETFGFCDLGEGGDFVMDGNIGLDGKFPIVTNGGLMSFGHAGTVQMLQKVIAAVEQLAGRVPDALKVPGAEVAMATNGGSAALFCDVMILGREQLQ
ncbi:thiolase family protein [Pseudomaricurvus alkylphenolicus]|jgi:acetyl-CoA acetyltransferase|uniref:thiolase family protein n=1 Tax=Pseudomaricurvus alkylphenolicus TaxID=1306991 RepID=UPI0014217235|nr:thiolase family protein [Pseudomaricurvus alkylphenolicus]NIB37974.1 thiolase family protein [Pseudomaricurvus alkylphenolicus]